LLQILYLSSFCNMSNLGLAPISHSKQGILDAFCAVLALVADLSVHEWSYIMQLVLVELK
jgi:hypothetical protein